MSISSIVAQGRRMIASTFLDTCVIADRTEVRDDLGGKKATWINRAGLVSCRFAALSDDVPTLESGQSFGIPTAVWLAPLGTDAKEGDRVTNQIDGQRWVITSDITPPSELAICVRMGIRKTEVGEAA